MTFSSDQYRQDMRHEDAPPQDVPRGDTPASPPAPANSVSSLLTAGYGLGQQVFALLNEANERHQLRNRVMTLGETVRATASALTAAYPLPAEEETVVPAVPLACDLQWAQLLDACDDYAVVTGWRFDRSHFFNLDQDGPEQAGGPQSPSHPRQFRPKLLTPRRCLRHASRRCLLH